MPLQPPPVGRLAPSPTGAQHLGNARTYLLAWLSIRSRGGTVILRVEDIDSPRIKAGAAEQALDDLRWLGLDWDQGPDCGGPQGPYVQTQRMAWYDECLDQLRQRQMIYPCVCTRADIEAAGSAPHFEQEGPVYPRTCAHQRAEDAAQLPQYCWRFRTSHEPLELHDLLAGSGSSRVAADLGDFVVQKADGGPAYQLAVVADDHAMGVTEVVRGADLLPSAFRQAELYRFFDWPCPQFVHVPLVVGADGRRLAKRHGDSRLATLRARGADPRDVVALLAWSCGLRPDRSATTPQQLLPDFRWDAVSRQPWVLTEAVWNQLLPS